MNRLIRLVHFNFDDQKYALFLSAVVRIIRVVEITGLPKAPEIVLGVINMHGLIIPVFDIRKRFRLPQREIQLDHQLIARLDNRHLIRRVCQVISRRVFQLACHLTSPQLSQPVSRHPHQVQTLHLYHRFSHLCSRV